MPNYHYSHENPSKDCPKGQEFVFFQSMQDEALSVCPECKLPVSRIIVPSYVHTPQSDSDLRDKGFAKLVKRSDGTYENVTALSHESKTWNPQDSSTMPDIASRIND